jgi:hypothetical protein
MKVTTPLSRVATPSPRHTGTATSVQPFSSRDTRIIDEEQPFLPTNTNTLTKTPTKTLTLTPTPVSTLQAHEWIPEDPLVILDSYGGDGGWYYEYPPHLVLYSDGQLLIYDNQAEPYPQLLYKKLDRQEMCAFLNTIDQFGFFDYDPLTYQIDRQGRHIINFPGDGSGTNLITVNAWQLKSVSLYGLRTYLWDEENFADFPGENDDQLPIILPALRNTFLFLYYFKPEDLQIFQPRILEIWIYDELFSSANAKTWPVDEPSLEYLVKNAQQDDSHSRNKIILKGRDAQKVFEVFESSIHSEVFTDGKNIVELYAMPLLPYENENGFSFPQETDPLSCLPSDGQLPWSP